MTVRHKKRLIKKLALLVLLLLTPFIAVAQPGEPPVMVKPVYADLTSLIPEPIPNRVLCNCYAYVKTQYTSLPSTAHILANLSTSGEVAVFYYASIGLHHYAVVVGETETHYQIEETNYNNCAWGYRLIPKNDASLLGFFDL